MWPRWAVMFVHRLLVRPLILDTKRTDTTDKTDSLMDVGIRVDPHTMAWTRLIWKRRWRKSSCLPIGKLVRTVAPAALTSQIRGPRERRGLTRISSPKIGISALTLLRGRCISHTTRRGEPRSWIRVAILLVGTCASHVKGTSIPHTCTLGRRHTWIRGDYLRDTRRLWITMDESITDGTLAELRNGRTLVQGK